MEPWRTVRAPGVNRSLLKDLTHQRQTSSLVQTENDRRTVRAPGADRPSFKLEHHQSQQRLWYNLSNSRRTVRAPWADRPPSRTSAQPEKVSLVQFELEWRTVRPPVPDCPLAKFSFHQSHTVSLVRGRTVRAPGADCPRPRGGLSALRQSALKFDVF